MNRTADAILDGLMKLSRERRADKLLSLTESEAVTLANAAFDQIGEIPEFKRGDLAIMRKDLPVGIGPFRPDRVLIVKILKVLDAPIFISSADDGPGFGSSAYHDLFVLVPSTKGVIAATTSSLYFKPYALPAETEATPEAAANNPDPNTPWRA